MNPLFNIKNPFDDKLGKYYFKSKIVKFLNLII